MTRIFPGRSAVQILAETIGISLFQNIQISASAHLASKNSFSLAVKWPVQTA
jgi:hypothetical protein